MKFYILIFFYILSSGYSFGQDITLRVLGYSNYTEYAESYVVLISTNESSLETIKNLKDSLVAKGYENKLVKIDDVKNLTAIQYKIEENDKSKFDNLLILCSDLRIKVDKIFFKMPEHLFEEEDQKAIMALNNANSQANLLANHLGYKIDKILNIDDETTYANPIFEDVDIDSQSGQLFIKLVELLGGRNMLYETESSQPTRDGGYNLWVTYNLKKK